MLQELLGKARTNAEQKAQDVDRAFSRLEAKLAELVKMRAALKQAVASSSNIEGDEAVKKLQGQYQEAVKRLGNIAAGLNSITSGEISALTNLKKGEAGLEKLRQPLSVTLPDPPFSLVSP